MALVKGTNAYGTVEEADVYFSDRLDVAAWTDANSVLKAQALVTATATLDELPWPSCAVSATQSLAFPKVGEYLDPKLGYSLPLSPVPDRIIKASFELAYHMLNNEGLDDETGRLMNLSVSSINMTSIIAPNRIPEAVNRLIKPLLLNGGSTAWWRAN